MAKKFIEEINIENAKIIFRNFRGEEKKFNKAGDRNFCVVIEDSEMAQKLADDGWNVRINRYGEGDEEKVTQYIPVSVRFDIRPPKIFMVNRRGQAIPMSEESIDQLDFVDFKNIDLTLRPRIWDDNGIDKVKAYLKTMYVTIEEDAFAGKYAEPSDEELPFK